MRRPAPAYEYSACGVGWMPPHAAHVQDSLRCSSVEAAPVASTIVARMVVIEHSIGPCMKYRSDFTIMRDLQRRILYRPL